mgnify:FL=1
MAQDIFLTQLKSIANISVDDKRPIPSETLHTAPDITQTSIPHVAFYALIAEAEEATGAKLWRCTFTLLHPESQQQESKTETYDSYYKILTNAKTAIEAVLEQATAASSAAPAILPARQEPDFTRTRSSVDASSLAGTWQGEESIDKIILLRGGKGFVIFKNGASMNVSVLITRADSAGNVSDIEVRQESKANASFFPQLPRETALLVAASAPPIVWSLHVNSDSALSGTKKTLVPDATVATGASEGVERISWTKK